jgi:hypothetical protein
MFPLSLRSLRIRSRTVFTIFSLGIAVMAGRADASTVTITVTGTVFTGTDYTNIFGLGTNAGLSGQQFNLVYTFDDTKGQQTVSQTPGTSSPCGSTIQNVGLSNPGTAVLQIGKGTWTFGQLSGDVASSLSERVAGACLGTPSVALDGVGQNDGVASSVADTSSGGTPDASVDSVETTIMLAAGTFPATGLSWENALSNSQFLYSIPLINNANAFAIAVSDEQTGMPSALALGTLTPASITVSGAASPPPAGSTGSTPLQFVPITPCRIADTRNPTGPFGGPGLTGGATREFDIPQSACSIPSSATAYSLNVTAVPNGFLGYLTVWPTGQPQPTTSTLNSDGRYKANAAIVPAGANGGVNLFVSDPSQVVLDISGYFAPVGTSSVLAFYPLTPCRLVDTRNATGPLGGPTLVAGTTRDFPLRSGACNLPSDAAAYSLNVTAVPQGSLPYLTIWPSGQSQPTASTLNAPTGTVVANGAIVPAGSNGDVNVYVGGTSDVVIDVNGYFAAPGAGGLSLYATTPCRVLDTRDGAGAFSGVTSVNVESSTCAPPSTAQAYVVNATVVPTGALNYLTLWPAGETQPQVSTLNAYDGVIASNMAIVPTVNGSINAFAANPTQLVLDLFGYYAP